MVKEDEGSAFMGEIIAAADSEGIQDGDLLCTLLHPEERKVPVEPPAPFEDANSNSVLPTVPTPDLGAANGNPVVHDPIPVPVLGHDKSTLKVSTQPKMDRSKCTKKMSIRMPNMGGSEG